MKKNILLPIIPLLISAFAVACSPVDKDTKVDIITPFSNTGSTYNLLKHQEGLLTNKGWNVKFRATGSCANGKNVIENSDNPVVYVWDEAMIPSDNTNHPCFMEKESPSQIVDIWYVYTDYLCRVGDNTTKLEDAKGRVTIGVNKKSVYPDSYHNELQAITQSKLIPIHYRNSTEILNAAKVGEVDYILTPQGPNKENSEYISCDYNMTTSSISNEVGETQSFSDTFGSSFTNLGIMYAASQNMPPEMMEEFRKDWVSTTRSEYVKNAAERMGWAGSDKLSPTTLEEKVNYIHSN